MERRTEPTSHSALLSLPLSWDLGSEAQAWRLGPWIAARMAARMAARIALDRFFWRAEQLGRKSEPIQKSSGPERFQLYPNNCTRIKEASLEHKSFSLHIGDGMTVSTCAEASCPCLILIVPKARGKLAHFNPF